jgi:hypothetical protein
MSDQRRLRGVCIAALLVTMVAAAPFANARGEYERHRASPQSFPPPMATPWNDFSIVELAANGGFETADFAPGWQVWNGSLGAAGAWFVSGQPFGPLSGFPLPTPTEGSYQAYVDQAGAGVHILYQDITIPPASAVSLYLAYWIVNHALVYSDPGTFDPVVIPNQQVRIDIVDRFASIDDAGAGVLLNVFKTTSATPAQVPYTALFADLTQFQGQTIRLRIAEVDNLYFLNVGIDAVSIQADVLTAGQKVTWGAVKDRYR